MVPKVDGIALTHPRTCPRSPALTSVARGFPFPKPWQSARRPRPPRERPGRGRMPWRASLLPAPFDCGLGEMAHRLWSPRGKLLYATEEGTRTVRRVLFFLCRIDRSLI